VKSLAADQTISKVVMISVGVLCDNAVIVYVIYVVMSATAAAASSDVKDDGAG
jgi:hypothetical protein